MICIRPETNWEAAGSFIEEDLAMLSTSGALSESEDEDASHHLDSCSDSEDSVQSYAYGSGNDDADFDNNVDDMDIEDNGFHDTGNGNSWLAENCPILSLVQTLLSHGAEIDLTDSKVRFLVFT